MQLIGAIFGSTEILKLVLGSMIWAELIGVPVAWLTLRGTPEWSNRSKNVRSLDILARYVGKITGMVGVWAVVILGSALFASVFS